jgi:hypothetical protein
VTAALGGSVSGALGFGAGSAKTTWVAIDVFQDLEPARLLPPGSPGVDVV